MVEVAEESQDLGGSAGRGLDDERGIFTPPPTIRNLFESFEILVID